MKTSYTIVFVLSYFLSHRSRNNKYFDSNIRRFRSGNVPWLVLTGTAPIEIQRDLFGL